MLFRSSRPRPMPSPARHSAGWAGPRPSSTASQAAWTPPPTRSDRSNRRISRPATSTGPIVPSMSAATPKPPISTAGSRGAGRTKPPPCRPTCRSCAVTWPPATSRRRAAPWPAPAGCSVSCPTRNSTSRRTLEPARTGRSCSTGWNRQACWPVPRQANDVAAPVGCALHPNAVSGFRVRAAARTVADVIVAVRPVGTDGW